MTKEEEVHLLEAKDATTPDAFCCSHSQKACVVYFTQTAAIAVVLIWSLFMLASTPATESRDLYVSLLSTCLGVFLPQPTLENSKNKII